jgi:transcriptional regulatory protein GAL4
VIAGAQQLISSQDKCYPIVHEATFRAQFMEVIPQPKSSAWQVLLHVIAAIGAFSSAECATTIDQALFKAAKARMSFDMVETGNLTMVQALTLLSNYSQKRNKPNSGYNYLGLAKRMAMGIGLHKEFTTWHAKPLVLEMRRRVWWLLYVFDVGAVITFSRPLDMPTEGLEVALPLNIHDRDITPMTQTFPKEVESTTLYTHVRCQTRFHLATNGIYARMISTPYPTADQMLELDANHLAIFENELPSWYQVSEEQPLPFRLPCAIMRWRIHNFRILMLRAFLMRQLFLRTQLASYQEPWPLPLGTSDEEQAVQGCLTASSECIASILAFWYQGTQNVLSCWYALYFLFQAVLVPVMCLRNEPISPMSDSWRDQIRRTIEVLNDMSRLNGAASKCLEIINSLCGVFLANDRGPSPINESPQTQLNNLYSYMWPLSDAQLTDDFALQDFPIQDLLQQIGDIS